MINRLIAMTMVCIFALSGAGYAAVKGDDTLPPLIIETNELRYAGMDIDWDDSPAITAEETTAVYKEADKKSAVVGSIQKDEQVPVIDAKAYIYPRMGKTKITAPVPATVGYKITEDTPKVGDTIYVIYAEPQIGAVLISGTAWYKGKIVPIPSEGIEFPYFEDFSNNPQKPPMYAVYEGYTVPDDSNYKIYEYYRTTRNGDYDTLRYYLHDSIPVSGRRNADIWLKVKLSNSIEGWVQLYDAHLGYVQNFVKPDRWWKNNTVQEPNLFRGISLKLYSDVRILDKTKEK